MSAPQCPICYPPTFTYDPPTEGLMPEACPARGNHEIIKRAFDYLWRMEARLMADAPLTSGRIELAAAAQARADIDRLRTAHQAEVPDETTPVLASENTAPIPASNTRVEHAQLMSGGDMHVWCDDPELDRAYLDERISRQRRFGGRVFRRTIIVVDDWTEVTDGR